MEEEMKIEEWMKEELDNVPQKGPEGTIRVTAVSNKGEQLVVEYDGHCWLAKIISVDSEHRDVKVEFLHPHCPVL